MKRIFLLILTNIAVMVVLSITASLLGADRFLAQSGLNVTALAIFAASWVSAARSSRSSSRSRWRSGPRART
jgi:heat shock protein HtpX